MKKDEKDELRIATITWSTHWPEISEKIQNVTDDISNKLNLETECVTIKEFVVVVSKDSLAPGKKEVPDKELEELAAKKCREKFKALLSEKQYGAIVIVGQAFVYEIGNLLSSGELSGEQYKDEREYLSKIPVFMVLAGLENPMPKWANVFVCWWPTINSAVRVAAWELGNIGNKTVKIIGDSTQLSQDTTETLNQYLGILGKEVCNANEESVMDCDICITGIGEECKKYVSDLKLPNYYMCGEMGWNISKTGVKETAFNFQPDWYTEEKDGIICVGQKDRNNFYYFYFVALEMLLEAWKKSGCDKSNLVKTLQCGMPLFRSRLSSDELFIEDGQCFSHIKTIINGTPINDCDTESGDVSSERMAYALKTADDIIGKINPDVVRGNLANKAFIQAIATPFSKAIITGFNVERVALLYMNYGAEKIVKISSERKEKSKEEDGQPNTKDISDETYQFLCGLVQDFCFPIELGNKITASETNGAMRIYLGFDDKENSYIIPFCYFCKCENKGEYPFQGVVFARTDFSARKIWRRKEAAGLRGKVLLGGDDCNGNLLGNIESVLVDAPYCYVIPSIKNKGDFGVVCIWTKRAFSYIELQLLTTLSNRFYNPIQNALRLLDLRCAHTRSAIASIISRNGSHNIGSHVLSALSHNIGTMPDDRVLYQYIQHRMDYIATATTDFPIWRQPTMFLGTMMKTFLSQRHLLDHIAGSEGLRAWKFQGRSVDDEKSSVAKIKFNIRKVLEDGNTQEVLSYTAAEGTVELDDDVALAIPGGTVGQHAFFTIIENVIRNAAKHDWSSPPSRIKDKGVKVVDSKGKVAKGNLEIFIDYKDIPEEGNVEFTIFANMSDANEVLDVSKGKTVFDKVKQAVEARFIDDRGTLRRANWGIAEMKISAGYLQAREPGVIGGLESSSKKALADDDRFGPEIIKPVRVKEDIGDEDGIEHLGYRFKVAKPRTLLIVVDRELEMPPERKKDLAALGVYIKTKTEVRANEADNSFEFVLIDSFTREQLTWLLPFRIVCVAQRSEMFTRIREVVATLEDGSISNSGETAESIAETLLSCRKYQLKNKVEGLLARVSACWIGYLKRRRMIKGQYNLVVNVEVQSDGSSQTSDASGQSLVNEAAAVSFVFEEGFKNVVEGFKELYKVEYDELKQILDVLTTKARKVDVDQYVKQSDDDCRKLIKMQMGSWLKDCNIDGAGDMRDFLETAKEDEKDRPLRKFVDYLEQTCKQAKGYLGKYSEKIVTLPEHFIAGKGAQSQQQSVKDDAHIIEHVLPSVYTESNPCEAGSPPSIKYIRHFKPKVATARTPEDIKNGKPPDFVTEPFSGLGEGPSVLYIEPLSGTQSYLTQIQTQIRKEDGVFKAKLVENALLRILIVDERVSKFISDHSDSTLATLSRMSIFIADDKAVTETLEAERDGMVNEQKHANVVKPSLLDNGVTFTPEGLVRLDVNGIKTLRDKLMARESVEKLGELYRPFKERFDILIIHQGILDKWFRGVVDDESMSSDLYDSFKKVFSYVVITTGRGTPANIPNMAKVLPFSTIETTLFRKYPEKLILVDAIMNILPHKKMNGEVVS